MFDDIKVPFGVRGEGTIVKLLKLIPDPDGSGLPRGRETGKTTTSDGLKSLGTREKNYDGECYDTGGFFSHKGELLHQLIQDAPRETTLVVVVDHDQECGTKTFHESIVAEYFAAQST